MSITSLMYTGSSGLRSHTDAMTVISDNIANVNTVGFKASRGNFTDVLGGVIGSSRVGSGSRIGDVQTLFGQGSFLGTGNSTDLAIAGGGFFMVSGVHQGVDSTFYSRAGNFQFDDQGFLISGEGLRVQGYPTDDNGVLSTGSPADLQIPTSSLPPAATTDIAIVANLDADQAVSGTPFDITDPGGTSDFSTSITTYDSLGRAHQVEVYFNKAADSPPQWQYNVVAASAELDPPPAGSHALLGTGTLDFNTDGSLQASSLTSVTAPWAGAAAATMNLNLGSPIATGGNGTDGITTYAGASAASFLEQDGHGSGEMAGLQISDDGTITGLFTNGETLTLGQLLTARFPNTDGLERAGGGLFAASPDAGNPVVGEPGSGGHGTIVAGSLEASNVDLASEFVNMIAVQRGFQSNSRSITTADEMLTEVTQLKR